MNKMLRPGDVLLLGLSGLLDVFEDVRDVGGMLSSMYRSVYGWVPARYQRHNFWKVTKRQLETGNIEKVVKGGDVYFRLTSVGEEKMKRDFPLLSLQRKHWDGKWRVVIFDIPQVSHNVRDKLRLKLKELGFGMLQESVWITPHDVALDVREFIRNIGLGNLVYVMEARGLLAGNWRALARRLWRLDELNEQYWELLEEVALINKTDFTLRGREEQSGWDRAKATAGAKAEVKTGLRGGVKTEARDGVKTEAKAGVNAKANANAENRGKDEDKDKDRDRDRKRGEIRKRVRQLRLRYLGLLLNDPSLPKELLPKDWAGEKLGEKLKRLANFA